MKSQYVKTNNLRTIRFSCFNQFSLTLLLTMRAYFVCVKCIGVRAIFCQGGAVNHLPKNFLQVAQNANFYKTVDQKRGP